MPQKGIRYFRIDVHTTRNQQGQNLRSTSNLLQLLNKRTTSVICCLANAVVYQTQVERTIVNIIQVTFLLKRLQLLNLDPANQLIIDLILPNLCLPTIMRCHIAIKI